MRRKTMKKLISLLVILTIVSTAFVACNNKKDDTPAQNDYSLAIGVVVTENAAKAKVTETVATIITDTDGKIVLCRLDCIDYTVSYTDEGALKTIAPTSKVTLGDTYTMNAGSWAAQGAALENHVKGKTQAEVTAIALDGGKATDAELKASCSIDITDLLKAIDNAFKSAHKITFKATAKDLKAGLSIVSSIKDSSKDESKNAKLTASFAATVLAKGEVVAAILDTGDVELKGITVAEESISAASVAYSGTKREQGDDYPAMPAGTWYVQADAYAKAAVGKTAEDIATLAAEGVAGCTINATEYKAGIEAAVRSAR